MPMSWGEMTGSGKHGLGRADEGLRVLFRPMMDLASGRITQVTPVVSTPEGASLSPAEVWARWPDLGFVLLAKVAAEVARWRAEGSPLVLVVPMATRLLDERLARTLYGAVRDVELSVEDLVVDVEASVFADEDRTARWAVQDLTSVGARVAARGFGEGPWPIPGMLEAGASELVLDMDAFKVDGDGEPSASAALAAGRALGWTTRAVNVTRVAELAFLAKVGCTTVHGDRLAPAATGDELTAHLAAQRMATATAAGDTRSSGAGPAPVDTEAVTDAS